MLIEYIVDANEVPWKTGQMPGQAEGMHFRCQQLLSGNDGGPEALRFQFDPCPRVYAHMHLCAQFQFLIGGSMNLPRDSMKIRPLGVHYTDHNKPYGPFSVGEGHDVLVLHPRQGGLMTMANRQARKEINLTARENSGMESDVEWHDLPWCAGGRSKTLMAIPNAGPSVVVYELPPDTPLALSTPAFGRYEVVLKGLVRWGERSVGPVSLRYVLGDELPAPLITGREGATVTALTFDQDALLGGLTGEGIAKLAGEAMASAI